MKSAQRYNWKTTGAVIKRNVDNIQLRQLHVYITMFWLNFAESVRPISLFFHLNFINLNLFPGNMADKCLLLTIFSAAIFHGFVKKVNKEIVNNSINNLVLLQLNPFKMHRLQPHSF